jgi:hypothetical protein
MDFTVIVAVNFSLYQFGVAAQLAGHSQVAVNGPSFPQQQSPYLAEQNNGSSSHVSIIPLQIVGTLTPAIVFLSNTKQVILLKLMNTNYLYWRMQMKSYLLGQGVFHFVDGSMSCPLLMFLTILLVLLRPSTCLFFVGSNRINLF